MATAGFAALLGGPSTALAQPCVITFPGLPPSDGTVGVAYEYSVLGISPFLLIGYRVTAGNLPPGLMLRQFSNESAVIVGTPTSAGRFTFTITATNGPLCSGEVTYTINIAAAVPTLPEWAMIALAVLLTVAGVVRMGRRTT